MSESKYDALKIENQICFPFYACSREIIKQYKPFLDEIGLTYTQYIAMMVLWEKKTMNIKEVNPTYEELKSWHASSGLPLKRFFCTSGLLYKSLQLKEKLPGMTEEEQLKLLASDGMLVKRPLVITKSVILTGFNEQHWQSLL